MTVKKQDNTGTTPTRIISTELVVVICAILLVAARVLLLQQRWISPDEGSYLMDARLILDGKITIADYPARQPIFLYVLALMLARLKLLKVLEEREDVMVMEQRKTGRRYNVTRFGDWNESVIRDLSEKLESYLSV